MSSHRFLYSASAAALGGRITRPSWGEIPVQAAMALPPSGGFGSTCVENYSFGDGLVSFRRATSQVIGNASEDGKVENTVSTVSVEGLNVVNMVTADRVVARLTSEHPSEDGELPILPVGSYFENLRIAGVPVELRPHEVLLGKGRTLRGLVQSHSRTPTPFTDPDGKPYQFDDLEARQVRPAPGPKAEHAPVPSFEDRLVLTSLFDVSVPPGAEQQSSGRTDRRCGWRIPVPGFGTVVLGEYFITRYSRRLTMLRLELGSPVLGTVEFSSGQGNGHIYP